MAIDKKEEIISYAILMLANRGYNPSDVDMIAKENGLSELELQQYYPDYETLIFDALGAITTFYARKIFENVIHLDQKAQQVSKKEAIVSFSQGIYQFFKGSELGAAFICIYESFKEDNRFERILFALKEEWVQMIQAAFNLIGNKRDAREYFNAVFESAKQDRATESKQYYGLVH